MHDVRRSARLVAWGNALLAGRVGLDAAVRRVTADDPPHRVLDLPGEPECLLAQALVRLRDLGAGPLRLALPVPGDVRGLPGPAGFNGAAVEAGESVLCAGPELGLVPHVLRHRVDADVVVDVTWRAHQVAAVEAVDAPSLAEAERELKQTLRESTQALDDLDVARWRPEVAARLGELRGGAPDEDGLAPGYPPRAHAVLSLARRLEAIATLAATDPGAAVSAGEITRREAALRPLLWSSRRAVVAAHNSAVEPAGQRGYGARHGRVPHAARHADGS